MEVVNIFLAGSIKMEKLRNIVRSCANKLQADNCTKGHDLAINITTFENFSSAITETKAQELYDAYIHSEADYALFIFENEVGGISKHEFDIAYQAFLRNNKPKLYIYFRKSDVYCADYEEIRNLLKSTNNYFLEYSDMNHFSSMIDSHLREIIEPCIEKIIINSYQEKGELVFKANMACSVVENGKLIADIKSGDSCIIELPEGIHHLHFRNNDSSVIIERTIRVIKNNRRTIYIEFPQQKTQIGNQDEHHARINKLGATFIGCMFLIAFITVIINFSLCQNDNNHIIIPDDIEEPGGERYQLALQYIEDGNLTMATELLQNVINLEPSFVEPYIHLAAIYKQQGDISKARELLQTALFLNPDSEWANELYNSISEKP